MVLNNRRIGLTLIITSTIIGGLAIGLDSLPERLTLLLLAISGVGFVSGVVLLNYKAKHSKRDRSKFKRTNTKSWDTWIKKLCQIFINKNSNHWLI